MKNKLKERSACSYSCCWQRQAGPLNKDELPERERTWRPERPPRSSSHKVCMCVCQLSSINDLLPLPLWSPGRLWKGIGLPMVPSLKHTHHTHMHTSWGSNTFLFPFHLSVKHTAGKSHRRGIWKWGWWVAYSGEPSFPEVLHHAFILQLASVLTMQYAIKWPFLPTDIITAQKSQGGKDDVHRLDWK